MKIRDWYRSQGPNASAVTNSRAVQSFKIRPGWDVLKLVGGIQKRFVEALGDSIFIYIAKNHLCLQSLESEAVNGIRFQHSYSWYYGILPPNILLLVLKSGQTLMLQSDLIDSESYFQLFSTHKRSRTELNSTQIKTSSRSLDFLYTITFDIGR